MSGGWCRFHYYNARISPAPIKLRNLLRAAANADSTGGSIVFCQQPEQLHTVIEQQREHTAVWLSSERSELDLERAIRLFTEGAATVLVCGVLGVRGLDFPNCRQCTHTELR